MATTLPAAIPNDEPAEQALPQPSKKRGRQPVVAEAGAADAEAMVPSTSQPAAEAAAGGPKNKEKVLVLSSRGITHR